MAVISFGIRTAKDALDIYRSRGYHTPQEELGIFLDEHGLREGYGSYWNASAVTVSTKNKVKVRAILGNQEKQESFKWMCKKSWYKESANFVITADDDMFGVTPENAMAHFGVPQNVLEFKNWKILFYGRDLSSML